ncbi:MAG: hypothetical protein KAY37_03060 [Phycisphaerae bacterium]|nr:hypothetical protein [Phycisphaerae bacterium]
MMSVAGPATFVVLLLVGLLLVAGALIWRSGRRPAHPPPPTTPPNEQLPCSQCGHVNPARAGFCARCGQELKRPES